MDRLPRVGLAFLLVLALPSSALAEQRTTRTRVQITSDPSGAAVYVDGAIERAGEAPVTLQLTPGDHRIRLVLQGYATEEQSVTVGRTRQTLSFRLIPVATVEITAANQDAEGATVNIDGQPLGPVPLTQVLEPGRHQVEVEREGFETFSRWLEVSAGQSYALTVSLQRSAPRRGTILVGGSISGAPVSVDGQAQGVTPAVVEVDVGQHTVVVSPEGQTPHTETVTVEAGARVTVNPTFTPAAASGSGSLRVLTQPAGATILIDGEEAGVSPVTVESLAPGSHIVEARSSGYETASNRITIEPGRRETVQLELTRGAAQTGRLRVTCDLQGAQVLLDGRPLGPAPATDDAVPAGEHQVLVRVPGHADWQQQIQVSGGGEVTVNATPQPAASTSTGFVTINADAPGAEVLIDGAVAGPAPLTNHELAAGQHQVEVRASGFQPFTTTVTVAAGGTQTINAALTAGSGQQPAAGQAEAEGEGQAEGEGESEEEEEAEREREEDQRTRFVNAASALRQWKLGVDASWGYPNFVGTYRVALGVYRNLDVALEARSSLNWTEIDAHIRYGIRLIRILGIGAELSIGGGFGSARGEASPQDRSAFVFGLTGLQGLEFTRWALTLRERLVVFSDNYYEGPSDDRHVLFFLGLALEIRLSDAVHLFAIFDYAPAQDSRRVQCWGNWVPTSPPQCSTWFPGDIAIEGRLGLGVRFF